MGSPEKYPTGGKKKARRELIEYGVNVIHLTLVFTAFTVYRRFLLVARGIRGGIVFTLSRADRSFRRWLEQYEFLESIRK